MGILVIAVFLFLPTRIPVIGRIMRWILEGTTALFGLIAALLLLVILLSVIRIVLF